METMLLVMFDENENKIVIGEYQVSACADEDWLAKWKSSILSQVRKKYPEAYGFYFEWEGSWFWQNEMMAQDFDDSDDDFEDNIFEYNE